MELEQRTLEIELSRLVRLQARLVFRGCVVSSEPPYMPYKGCAESSCPLLWQMEVFLCYLKSQRVKCYKEETENICENSQVLVAFLPLTFFSKGGWPLRTCLQNNSELPMHAHGMPTILSFPCMPMHANAPVHSLLSTTSWLFLR